jgi:uncharacterized membrane protein
VTCAAFLLRTFSLDWQSLWRDEVDAIRFSDWAIRDLVAGLTQPGHNGPLFFFLLRFWRSLTGNSEFALRYPSALMGSLMIPLGFVLARQLGLSRRVGFLIATLLATSPYLVWYGQEAKMYTTLMVLVTLAAITYLRALSDSGRKWWVIFVLTTSFSFYLHILAPLMLAVYTVIAYLYRYKLRTRWRAWLMSMGCLTLPYLPLVFWQLSFFIEGKARGHPFYPLHKELFILLQLYSGGLFKIVGLTGVILYLFLFFCGLFLINHRGTVEKLTPAKRLFLATWAVLPPLAVYFVSLRVPIFEDRYLIYITPAFYLLIASGIVLLRHYGQRLAAFALGLVLIVNFTGIWQQQRGPVKADFRAAAAYLANQAQRPSAIMIQMPYLQHTFNYYYPYQYRFLEGLWTNDGKTEDTVHAEMSRLSADLPDLWLVVSERDTWDNRHLVQGWLDKHADLLDKANFMRVDVYHYQLRPNTPGAIETQDLASE